VDLETLKARYDEARDAYNEIAAHNLECLTSGNVPTIVELRREEMAREILANARRSYWGALCWPQIRAGKSENT